MSASNTEEKDTSNIASDDEEKSTASEEESSPGLLLSSGEINWDCPCLDGMASGPCGEQFKESFICMYNTNDNDEDNLHCLASFKNLFSCMSQYPDFYRNKGFGDEFLNTGGKPNKAEPTEDQKDKTESRK